MSETVAVPNRTHPRALVERDRELRVLSDATAAATSGAGSVVLVEGPAGIGKTALLASATAGAPAAALVLGAAGGEIERGLAWGVARGLLGPALAGCEQREREVLLGDAASLAGPLFGYPGPDVAAGEATGARLHGLYWLVANLSERRALVLVVDDAQWADAPSLRWLAHLAARVDGLSLALVLAVREGEGEAAGAGLDAVRPYATLLHPAPLSRAGCSVMLAHELDEPPSFQVVERCHWMSGGSPLLIQSLARELAVRAPDAIDVEELRPYDVGLWVKRRLARLSDPAHALLQAVAVLGLHAPLALAGTIAGIDQHAAAAAADELVAANLLDAGLPLVFVHPLVRDAAYDSLTAAARSEWHARAVDALRDAGGAADEIAVHLLAVEPAADERARDTLAYAGIEALGRGAPDTAARFLERALAESPSGERRGELLHLLGLARTAMGGSAGFATLEQAFEVTPDPASRAAIALDLGRAGRMVADFRRGIPLLERSLSELAPDDPLTQRVEGEWINLSMLYPSSVHAARERLQHYATPETIAEVHDAGLLADLALLSVAAGTPPEISIGLAHQALTLGAERELNPSALVYTLKALALCDELDEARREWDEVLTRAQQQGSRLLAAFASIWRAEVHLLAGSVSDAHADAAFAVDTFSRLHAGPLEPVCFLADALRERGQLDAAEAALAELDADDPRDERRETDWTRLVLLLTRGRLRLAQGRSAEAVTELLACGHQADELTAGGPPMAPALLPWRSAAALALLATDQRQQARRLVDDEVELARAASAPRTLAGALRVAGFITGGAEGLAMLEEAVELLSASPARLERARALVSLGAALRRDRSQRGAQQPLRQGLDLASRCGAEALAAQARDELALSGARPRRDRITGRDALTAGELRVARLAAQDHSNRDIAQRLFLTQRTVETHLTHAYRKLDINSRHELARALTPHP